MVKKEYYRDESLGLALDHVEVFQGRFFCMIREIKKCIVTEGYQTKI